MKTDFDHEQSMALINEVIHRARNNFQKGRIDSIIYWGYLIAAIAIANVVLLHTLKDPNYSFLIWAVTIPGAIVSLLIDRRVDRSALVKTHIDKIADTLWKGFGISVAIFLVVIYAVAHCIGNYQILLLITPVIMVMIGMGQFATACIYRYGRWYSFALLFWVGAVVCSFSQQDVQFIILAVCMILGYAIPGHLLIRQEKKNHV